MDKNDVVVVIPAYNPTKDLVDITNNLYKKRFRVVVVNDGSKEEYTVIFKRLDSNIFFLEHKINMGKGEALKTAFKYVLENLPCSGVVTADADGQHLLKDITNVASSLLESNDTVILGSRLDTSTMPLRSKFGNSVTRTVFKIASHTNIFDTQTGLRGIPFSLLKELINVEGSRYEYEINMLLYFAKNKIKVKEIGITTIYENNNSSSSFRIIKDSAKIYKCIIKNSDIYVAMLYTISSILAFGIDFFILMVMKNIFENQFNPHISLLVCVVIARVCSSLFNFTFNRTLVFKSKNKLIVTLLQYYSLVIAVLIAHYLLLDLLTNILNQDLAISKICVEIILFVSNYFIQKLFIFKNRKEEHKEE